MSVAPILLTCVLLLGAASSTCWARSSGWQIPLSGLERELAYESPAHLGATRYTLRPLDNQLADQVTSQPDQPACVEPTRTLYDNFVRQFGRNLTASHYDRLDRYHLFAHTLNRTIVLNRILQNEMLNLTNYQVTEPEVRNYYFAPNVPNWYSDINDCELGLMKYILFDVLYLVDRSELALAYQVVMDNNDYLPLMTSDGFEQVANILLIRLFDQFRGDEKMRQLFEWPLYMKKLAGYAYNRRQMSEPNFKAKMSLLTYAYPSYFSDLKYNGPAVNRTDDNLKAHQNHERFNKNLGRKFSNLKDKNRRLVIFRQRWTLLNLLTDNKQVVNVSTLAPEWQRPRQRDEDLRRFESDKLREASDDNLIDGHYRVSQFSDLTDQEFVAFLTNDYGPLENNPESVLFLESNFPIQKLDEQLKDEIALELELRRLVQRDDGPKAGHLRDSFQLARRVVDELISEVGLPIGHVMVTDIKEEELYSVFNKVSNFFAKSYSPTFRGAFARLNGQLNTAEIDDERQRRMNTFKFNYGRFRAWFIKEGWQLEESQLVAMLRLADMSWSEIKLSLFKVCCLTKDQLHSLGSKNATLQYLGSNQFMCQQLSPDSNEPTRLGATDTEQASELAALELYYYYSVHFNKHHSNVDSFNRHFEIFRHNIDQIRRQSCIRSLTLYRSLKLKLPEKLNSIDTLDQRRSYTDDINLDRYKYFTVLKLSSSSRAGLDQVAQARTRQSEALSRAGVSYRRGPNFQSLLENPEVRGVKPEHLSQGSYYVDKLSFERQNTNLNVEKYRRNSAQKIYELVMQRYRYCMRTVKNIEPSENDLHQQCLSSSGDDWSSPSRKLQLQQQDPCALYRLGLEPWAEGLIEQNPVSRELIRNARC